MRIRWQVAAGALLLTAIGCQTRDFVCVEVRDVHTRNTPVNMSYAYLFEQWSLRDIILVPYRATLGGSGPFYNKNALLMPVPGSPLRVKIWVSEQKPVEFKFVAPSTPYEPTEWLSGVPPTLELRAWRCPRDGEPIRAVCEYLPESTLTDTR